MRSLGIVVRLGERNFAAIHVGANCAFARIWCGIVWVSMSVAYFFLVLVAGIFLHCSRVKRFLKINMNSPLFTGMLRIRKNVTMWLGQA